MLLSDSFDGERKLIRSSSRVSFKSKRNSSLLSLRASQSSNESGTSPTKGPTASLLMQAQMPGTSSIGDDVATKQPKTAMTDAVLDAVQQASQTHAQKVEEGWEALRAFAQKNQQKTEDTLASIVGQLARLEAERSAASLGQTREPRALEEAAVQEEAVAA